MFNGDFVKRSRLSELFRFCTKNGHVIHAAVPAHSHNMYRRVNISHALCLSDPDSIPKTALHYQTTSSPTLKPGLTIVAIQVGLSQPPTIRTTLPVLTFCSF